MKDNTRRVILLISGMNTSILLILFLLLFQPYVYTYADLINCLAGFSFDRCSEFLGSNFVPFLIMLSSLYYIYAGYKKLVVNNWILYSSISQLCAAIILGFSFFVAMIGFVASLILYSIGFFGLYLGFGVSVVGVVMFIIGFFIRLIKKI